MRIGAVMLAAGAATRMGRIKQLLPYRGETLIRHAISQAAAFSPLVVVLGANAPEIEAHLDDAPCHIVVNEQWETGMGSTFRVGMTKMLELAPDIEGVAALLADQPHVLAAHLNAMVQMFEDGKWPIVAAEYNGASGVPAIFGRALTPTLLNLPPEAGARHLLRDAGSSLFRYALPEAAIDVDTPQDYAELS